MEQTNIMGFYQKAKTYLKHKQNFEEFQCGICYDICLQPVCCNGPCKAIFCSKCVTQWRLHHDQCPSRCSKPFLIIRVPNVSLEFYCPYNCQKCQLSILSLEQFQKHYQICHFVPNFQIKTQQFRKQYQCNEGHRLQFFIGTYEQMCKGRCEGCQQTSKLCRSICRKCNNLYCVECRMPPCSKKCCPSGHLMKYQKICNLGYICDICGVSTMVSGGKGVYDDQQCNFGICEQCYEKLPQNNELQLKGNNCSECQCKNELTLKASKLFKKKCSLCQKTKNCPKYCQKCNKYYCLNCKNFIIETNLICQYNHELIKIYKNQSPKLSNYICMKCQNAYQNVFYDQYCEVQLCTHCLQYEKSIRNDKQRFIQILQCMNGHQLKFYSGNTEYKAICHQCNQSKIMKLFCPYCQKGQNFFCCSCKGISFKTCYLGHSLKQMLDQDIIRSCQVCCQHIKNKQHLTTLGCQKCNFYICSNCYSDNLANFQF